MLYRSMKQSIGNLCVDTSRQLNAGLGVMSWWFLKASLHDATFIQNIIGFLLKNVLDQKLYRVDARKTLLDDPQQNPS